MNPFWRNAALFILGNRLAILVVIALLTGMMVYFWNPEITQDYGKVVPANDDEYLFYLDFKKEFGEDGNVIILCFPTDLKKLSNFQAICQLSEKMRTVEGVENIVSPCTLFDITTDTVAQTLSIQKISGSVPQTQSALDSITSRMDNLPFFRGLVIDSTYQSAIVAVTVNKKLLDSKKKIAIYNSIKKVGDDTGKSLGVEPKYAGLPVLRATLSELLPREFAIFIFLAYIVTALTVWYFFRSFYPILVSTIIVGVMIIWGLGIQGLSGYKITVVTGIVPALITVIGVPNTIYLTTRYHIEYTRLKNKFRALVAVLTKIGIVTVITNATTAIGLGVTAITNISILREFGIIAGITVICAFFVSILLIPIIYSYLPDPNAKQTRHLERSSMGRIIQWLDGVAHYQRGWVFIVIGAICIVSFVGIQRIRVSAKMTDDIPENSQLMKDLYYMESHFGGVMPLEFVVDTKNPKGLQKINTLRKIESFQEKLQKYPEVSRSLSIVDMAKFVRQGFFGGASEEYMLPSKREFPFIADYLKNSSSSLGEVNTSKRIYDSLWQKARISANIKDIGSYKMRPLLDSIRKDADSVFDSTQYKVTITGTTHIYIKGNSYLIQNLISSLIAAFLAIALLMWIALKRGKLVLIAMLTNVPPLLAVAGLMGFAGIPMKPSTALIFSITLGIAIDNTIHFLSRYSFAKKSGHTTSESVTDTFRDTGISMIYTSLILFFGFIIFMASSFGGTRGLGILSSITLFMALISNLFFLPAMVMGWDKDKKGA